MELVEPPLHRGIDSEWIPLERGPQEGPILLPDERRGAGYRSRGGTTRGENAAERQKQEPRPPASSDHGAGASASPAAAIVAMACL